MRRSWLLASVAAGALMLGACGSDGPLENRGESGASSTTATSVGATSGPLRRCTAVGRVLKVGATIPEDFNPACQRDGEPSSVGEWIECEDGRHLFVGASPDVDVSAPEGGTVHAYVGEPLRAGLANCD